MDALEKENVDYKEKFEKLNPSMQMALNMFKGEDLPNPSIDTEDHNLLFDEPKEAKKPAKKARKTKKATEPKGKKQVTFKKEDSIISFGSDEIEEEAKVEEPEPPKTRKGRGQSAATKKAIAATGKKRAQSATNRKAKQMTSLDSSFHPAKEEKPRSASRGRKKAAKKIEPEEEAKVEEPVKKTRRTKRNVRKV